MDVLGVVALITGSFWNVIEQEFVFQQGLSSCSNITMLFRLGYGFNSVLGKYKVTCGPITGQ